MVKNIPIQNLSSSVKLVIRNEGEKVRPTGYIFKKGYFKIQDVIELESFPVIEEINILRP